MRRVASLLDGEGKHPNLLCLMGVEDPLIGTRRDINHLLIIYRFFSVLRFP